MQIFQIINQVEDYQYPLKKQDLKKRESHMTKSIDYVDIYRSHTKNRLLVRIDTVVFFPQFVCICNLLYYS